MHIRTTPLGAALILASVSTLHCGSEDATGPNEQTTTSALRGHYSLWSSSSAPKVASDSDSASVELGTKFRADVAGDVTAVRFYKSRANSGQHTGHLWRSDGTLLASVTFAGETSSGWQTATFGSPVRIAPGVTYVISYHTNVGHYAGDNGYFAGHSVDRGPLHGLADGTDGHNGVYRYGASGVPSDSWQQTNYWVDLVFAPSTSTSTADAGAPAPVDAGAPAPEPEPTPTPTPTPTPAPSTGGFPDATNTGVPAGVTLTPSGGIHVTTPGAVVSGMAFDDTVYIDANNVTLKNCTVKSGAFYDVKIKDGLTGVVVQDCEIDNRGTGGQGIHGPGTFLRNNIYHCSDGIDVGGGDNTVIQDNYVHDMAGPSDAHFDTIQADGGYSTLTIRHNTLINEFGQTSAVMVDDYWGSIHGVIIDNNRLIGGGYTVYAGSWNGNEVTGIQVTNNRLGRGYYGYADIAGGGITWSGNVDDVTGAPAVP
jgi:hypothetical protein